MTPLMSSPKAAKNESTVMELEVGVGTTLGTVNGSDVTGKLMRALVMTCFSACLLILWVCDHAFHS